MILDPIRWISATRRDLQGVLPVQVGPLNVSEPILQDSDPILVRCEGKRILQLDENLRTPLLNSDESKVSGTQPD